jgi:hypothetical protein
MGKMELALVAGIVALMVGLIAGYFLGKPQVTAAPPGILGTLSSLTGIKL